MYIEVMSSEPRHKDRNGMTVGGKTAHNIKAPKATAEQLRLAQIVNDHDKFDESQSIEIDKIVEITGTTKESALFALYDANNDTNRAIELILSGQSNGWETATRGKKNKTPTMKQEDEKIEESPPSGQWEKTESRGRGRRNKRGNNDRNQNKQNDTEIKQDVDRSTDRASRGRRGGRGRGAGGRGRSGRGRGGSAVPPRRFNRYRGGGERFNGSRETENQDSESKVETWNAPEENWDLEVGTWTNEDSKKEKSKTTNANYNADNWGSDSWNEDLSSSKVFQAQNAPTAPPPVERISPPPVVTADPPVVNHHIQNTTPQMGERIDIDSLFKKTNSAPVPSGDNVSSYGNNFTGDTNHSAPTVIQQLQQQGQSTSLFSENKLTTTSRLFGGYETNSTQGGVNDIFNAAQTSVTEHSYTQFNGKINPAAQEQSTFLGSLGKRFAQNNQQSSQPSQANRLGHLSDSNQQNVLSSFAQTHQQHITTTSSPESRFSEDQQQQATDAVKSSLGMPIGGGNASVPRSNQSARAPSLPTDIVTDALSFGSPLPPRQTQQMQRQQQQRKKMQPKIPSMAVEMPGSSNYSMHSLSNFSLQFGVDDAPSAVQKNEYNANTQAQNTRFNDISSTTNHAPDSSIFSTSLGNSTSQDTGTDSIGGVQRTPYHSLQSSQDTMALQQNQISSSNEASQNLPDSTSSILSTQQRLKDEQPRAPPGLTLPVSGASALSNLSSGMNAVSRNTDLESSYGSHHSSNDIGSRSQAMDGSLNRGQGLEGSSNYGNQRSFYSISNSQQSSEMPSSAGQSLRSPGPSSNLPGSLQSSPMPKGLGGSHSPPVEGDTGSGTTLPASIATLTNSLQQVGLESHISSQDSSDIHNSMPPYIQSTSPSRGLTDNNSVGGISGYGVQDLRTSSHSLPSSSPLGGSYNASVTTSYAGMISSNNESSLTSSQQLQSQFTMAQSAYASKSSVSNKGPPNMVPGVAPMLPGSFGIPMASMLPYTPDMAYSYDPLLLQSRVHPMLNQYADLHFQSNTAQAVTMMNRESSGNTNQSTTGGNKYSRDHSSPTPTPAGLSTSLSSGLSQHQSGQIKGTQATAHPQQFLGTVPAYPANYGIGAPYYPGVGMNSYQFPATMFATAMHQPSKHPVNTTTGFQQHGTGFNHSYTSASNVSSSSGVQDLQSNYSKSHSSAFDKQSFHQHTNTPPPAFNVQAIAAAVAGGQGATPGSGTAGLGPYPAAPYMTMMPSQIHLLQHQDNAGGQSQRNQSSNSIGKPTNKNTAYGGANYWGN